MSRQTRVLLVDDNAQYLALRRILLQAFGFEVTAETSPRQALRRYQLQPFDIALLDFQMPEMNGAELACELKGVRPEVPIVIISGLDRLPDDVPAGYDAFFPKTTCGFDLIRKIEAMVKQKPPNGPASKISFKRKVMALTGVLAGMASARWHDSADRVRDRVRHRPIQPHRATT